MSMSLVIALRYAKPGGVSRKGFLSFVSGVSLAGLFLGVVALIVVVSVMNGFDRELKRRILGVTPHVVVEGAADALPRMRASPLVTRAEPYLEASALLVGGNRSQLVTVQGLSSTDAQRVFADGYASVPVDSLHEGNAIMLSESVAASLGLFTGDPVTLALPEASAAGGAIKPDIRRTTLVGVFDLGSTLDHSLALMSVPSLGRLLDREPAARLTLANVFDAPRVASEWRGQGYEARSWTQTHGDFFEAVRMEKIMMFILLSFVVAIAAFGIVSGLSMMVQAKRSEIAVLRTLGLPVNQVMWIFVAHGMFIALVGIVAGVALGVPLAYQAPEIMAVVERLVGASIIEGTYFDRIPVDVRLPDVLAVVGVTLAISLVASLYPARQAARSNPAEVLRQG